MTSPRALRLLAMAALAGGCATTYQGNLADSWPEVDKKLLDTSYPQALYVEAPVVDPKSTPDFSHAAAEFSRTYQDALATFCRTQGLFASCTTVPAPGAFTLSTQVRIDHVGDDNVAAFVLCGWLLPPLLGFAYSWVFLAGSTQGAVLWELKDQAGTKIMDHTWKIDTGAPPEYAFHTGDGFPKFLADASQVMIAHYGTPRALVQQALAPPPPPAVEAPVVRPPRAKSAVVAVFDVQDSGGKLDHHLLEQLTEYLAAQLIEVARYRVVPRAELRHRLAEEKKGSYQACFDESCQIELGKAVAAEKSLQTKLLKVGATCAITATLYDLKSETTEAASSVEGDCSENALLKNMKQLAQKLAAQ
jgi:hypothetical protein